MLHITKERPEHFTEIDKLLLEAFKNDPYSDHGEGDLVRRIRASEDFISDLALVALEDEKVVGYILVSPLKIVSQETKEEFPGLTLAPVAVLPEKQGQKIGAQLIERAHETAKALGHDYIVLLGHDTYYPRFGYEVCKNHNIEFHFQVPPEYCMVKEITPNSLEKINGLVHYPETFF
ncbi:MAG: GNAT family N-acetyltransferase [Flavobacteriaceae bacterium]